MTIPYLLFVFGPTASGKGSLPGKVIEYLKLPNNEANPPVKLLIDELVEHNPSYKRNVTKFIETKKKEGLENTKIVDLFLHPTPYIYDYFNKAYYTARQSKNCETGVDLHKSMMSCNTIIDNKLQTAISQKQNIIFESTGISYPDWMFKLYGRELENYSKIMAWTVVDICTLYQRNLSRAEQSLREYMNNNTKNTPRLPDIRPNIYIPKLIDIIKTFMESVLRKTNIRLLIYDNNTRKSKLLYDSNIHSTKTAIQSILGYNVTADCNHIFSKLDGNKSSKHQVKKPSVKKLTIKKQSIKKTTVKKLSVKKLSVKKLSVKKPIIKKSSVKKTAGSKILVKKLAIKKTPVKRTIIAKLPYDNKNKNELLLKTLMKYGKEYGYVCSRNSEIVKTVIKSQKDGKFTIEFTIKALDGGQSFINGIKNKDIINELNQIKRFKFMKTMIGNDILSKIKFIK